MKKIKQLEIALRINGGGLFHNSRADARCLAECLSKCIDKINELVAANNYLQVQFSAKAASADTETTP